MGTNFGHFSWDDDPVGVDGRRGADPTVLATLHQQSELLERLVERLLTRLDHRTVAHDTAMGGVDQDVADTADPSLTLEAENDQLRRQVEQLRRNLRSADPVPGCDPETLRPLPAEHETTDQDASLEDCNVSDARRSEAAAGQPHPADLAMELTWEQRKQRVFEQLDQEAVDTESFLSALHEELEREVSEANPPPTSDEASEAAEIKTLDDAIAQLNAFEEERQRLADAVDYYKQQAEQYFEELQNLKRLTPSPATGRDQVGKDQAIEAERARLAELQTQCEQQVRDLEIRSSLERAKLSRENSELRQHLDELRRQVSDFQKHGSVEGGGRRWMAKLGLNSEDTSG